VRRGWLVLMLLALPLAAAAQFTAPYVTLQGTMNSSSGTPAANATLTLVPSQLFFVPGSSVVVSEAQCGTDASGAVVGIGNPITGPRVSIQLVGTLPAGNYYVKFAWYDQFGKQTLPSPEVAAQLTGTGELQILPPVGSGPPSAVGMAVYIGTAPGGETLQGTTNTPTAQFTQAVPLGSPVGSISITSGGQYASCPTAFTFTASDAGTGASAVPICGSIGGGLVQITGYTSLIGGQNYTVAPVVSTNGTPSVAPVLAANLNTTVTPQISNGTSCRVVANDAGFPTGTGYTASLTDASGNTLFNYAELWQFYGAGSTYNLSQGIPYYHGQVTYPIPILTIPFNHNPQAISGPLSLNGYNLFSVGAVGVGTATPAWGVDVEGAGLNSRINALGGYLVNGNGGTVGECLTSDGTAFDLPLGCSDYQTIQAAGTPLPQEAALNFAAGFTVTDDPTNHRTNVALGGNKVVLALPATGVTATSCTTPATVTLIGTYSKAQCDANPATCSTFTGAFQTIPNAATGWGANGGLVVELWPDATTTNTLDWSICNQTTGTINPTAINFNVGVN
jgi:hypothetical protein